MASTPLTATPPNAPPAVVEIIPSHSSTNGHHVVDVGCDLDLDGLDIGLGVLIVFECPDRSVTATLCLL